MPPKSWRCIFCNALEARVFIEARGTDGHQTVVQVSLPMGQVNAAVVARSVFCLATFLFGTEIVDAQEGLTPRAYVITPIHSNAVTLTYSYQQGDILFNPATPIADAGAQIEAGVLSYYHAFSFFGRSANITGSLPYAVGIFAGRVEGSPDSVYRSGLTDASLRFSVNLKGGPAMGLAAMRDWRQKTLIGLSLTVEAPTGQYDPARLINPGFNRWGFKPELGLSRRWGSWLLDIYNGVWLYTENPRYFPSRAVQTQRAIGSLETHLSYDLRPRLWFSLDGNFWYGGVSSVNRTKDPRTRQESSRVGFTAAMPVSKHQSLKFSYSITDYALVGNDFQNVSAAWQYSWVGKSLGGP